MIVEADKGSAKKVRIRMARPILMPAFRLNNAKVRKERLKALIL
jgi:hypothetical protein